MWLLPGAIQSNNNQILQYVSEAIAEDLQQRRPRLIVVHRATPESASFDYLEYFSRYPAVQRQLEAFRPVATTAHFILLQRTQAASQTR